MEVFFYRHVYNGYGGGMVYSPIGDLLELRLDDYGEAITSFHIEAYLRSATYNPLPTLEGLFKQYHAYLEKLPKITFHRKLRRVTIEFESKVRTAEDEESRRVSVETTNAAMREFTTILPLLEKRLKKGDDFDYPRFISDANRLLSQGFATEEEIQSIQAQAKRNARLSVPPRIRGNCLRLIGASSTRRRGKFWMTRSSGNVRTTLHRTATTRERTYWPTTGSG